MYENENGHRWCGPSVDVQVVKPVEGLVIEVFSTLPKELGRNQTIVAYGSAGEVGRLILTADQPCGQFKIGDVAKDERITMHSIEAFCPSWAGSKDNRLLSFYIKTED